MAFAAQTSIASGSSRTKFFILRSGAQSAALQLANFDHTDMYTSSRTDYELHADITQENLLEISESLSYM